MNRLIVSIFVVAIALISTIVTPMIDNPLLSPQRRAQDQAARTARLNRFKEWGQQKGQQLSGFLQRHAPAIDPVTG